ncbi:hypothetical protein PROFUN_13472 [Planoprotostelium fungivorum]|uniref:UBA domain-containing protein n=1 Tax=Planoprotostelium fungivorum TaxID=1890364 RepID=A0A2P6N3U0_9EUKA|nr:hypothetical protein PROFUN_13472 [Planoprotostelium fungivorum]
MASIYNLAEAAAPFGTQSQQNNIKRVNSACSACRKSHRGLAVDRVQEQSPTIPNNHTPPIPEMVPMPSPMQLQTYSINPLTPTTFFPFTPPPLHTPSQSQIIQHSPPPFAEAPPSSSSGNVATSGGESSPTHDDPSGNSSNPPSFYIRSEEEKLQMKSIFVAKGLKHMSDPERASIWEKLTTRVEGLRRFVTIQQKKQLIDDFWSNLKTYSDASDLIDVPTIIWERSMKIHHLNAPFRKLCQWDLPLPHPDFLCIMQMFSLESVEFLAKSLPYAFVDSRLNTFHQRLGIRSLHSTEEKYTEGNAVVSIKRDVFGLPSLFVCHFSPDPREDEQIMILPIGAIPTLMREDVDNFRWSGNGILQRAPFVQFDNFLTITNIMLNSGPSGFRESQFCEPSLTLSDHAPLSKCVLLLTGSVSVLASIMKFKHNLDFPRLPSEASGFLRLFSHHIPFTGAGELLFGFILIYTFRMFERHMGTRKFGMFILASTGIYSSLQLALYVIAKSVSLPSGPYPFIFACMSLYISEIPPTYKFKLCGIPASDKLFVYLVAAQLMLANYPGSLISGFLGIVSASLYRSPTLKLDQFTFPNSFIQFCSQYILPIIETTKAPQRHPVAFSTNASVAQEGSEGRRAQRLNAQQAPATEGIIHETEWNEHVQPVAPSDQNIAFLMALGFSQEQANVALRRANNDLQLATNLLLDAGASFN